MMLLVALACLTGPESSWDSGGPSRAPIEEASIAVGEHFVCTSTVAGEVSCRGEMEAPAGPWWGLDASGSQLCALDGDATPACWGEMGAPEGPAAVVAAGDEFVCTLDLVGDIKCLGTDAPLGQGWQALSARGRRACAISSEGVLVCWGVSDEVLELGTGPWNLVDVGPDEAVCAIASSPTPATGIDCFGPGESDSYGGRYTSLGAGPGWWCATTPDGNIACEGAGAPEDLVADEEIFTFHQVDVGVDLACGLDLEGRTACWGVLPAWL